MVSDKEGKLWIGHWDGWAVRRWDPETGKCLQELKLPCARVTSVCWGGDQLTDLYITTAKRGLTKEDLERQPNAGGAKRIRLGFGFLDLVLSIDIFIARNLSPGGYTLHDFGCKEAVSCDGF